MTTVCPTCGRGPGHHRAPADQVVTGDAGPDVAPLLCEAWEVIRAALQSAGRHQVRQQDLVALATALTGCAEYTATSLIAAAVRAGHVEREYRHDGTPTRRRSYLTWRDAT